jgi:hypothetical protein
MRFVNFEGLKKDKITTDIQVGGVNLDLHNEWYFVSYYHQIPSKRFSIGWVNESHPDVKCFFDFDGIKSVKIERSGPEYSPEDSQTVSEILYQECDGLPPTIKFWFQDELTIEISAESLTLKLEPMSD